LAIRESFKFFGFEVLLSRRKHADQLAVAHGLLSDLFGRTVRRAEQVFEHQGFQFSAHGACSLFPVQGLNAVQSFVNNPIFVNKKV